MSSTASSSAGLLSLLSEDDERLKLYALENLDRVVHQFWFQISSAITSVEVLYEDASFSHRKLAALVASKVYYYLGEMRDALEYALGAENLFEINDSTSQYVKTLLSCALDLYFENQATEEESDTRLVSIVERLLERCCREGAFEQAVGICLESRRLDLFRRICEESTAPQKLLAYALRISQRLIISKSFQREVLTMIVQLSEKLGQKDWQSVCHCLALLKESERLAQLLGMLLKGSLEETLLAYQISFELVENESQNFVSSVEEIIWESTAADNPEEAESENEFTERRKNLSSILSGRATIKLHLNFLYSHNHADLQLLKNVKAVVDARHSVCYSATVFANAMMHCGTTVDTFLRDNLDWLARGTYWSKFNATAGLGVTHKGHLENGVALMQPYLPPGATGSPYSEGGALFALGLIHANHGHEIQELLLKSLREAQSEVIQHGACLGLGIAALGSESAEINELIKTTVFSDNAVAGQAAGIALGLVNVGVMSDMTADLLAYAHETQHEKIILGISIGLALMMYGQDEEAEVLIEQMTTDQDAVLRYSGMFVIGLAYAGRDSKSAIQKLLHFAVSDVSDDVRRGALTCLGFVLLGNPERCPRMVSLLSESFNPHVRYGSAMALGIACGGTGMKEAQNVLQPMLSDPVDFVRQGALIAMALILMQSPESQVGPFRKTLVKFVTDKTEETMCRMGAIMATGILDAGGRNLTVGCRAASGQLRRAAVVGLALFTQYWYWYPLAYFLSLVFQPAALIGLNENLDQPKFDIVCTCKESFFGYPEQLVEEVSGRSGKKVAPAVLSTTEKAKERAKKKSQSRKPAAEAGPSSAPMDVDVKQPTHVKKLMTPAPEAETHCIENPARVVPQQEPYVEFRSESRWVPVKGGARSGIVMLRDTKPEEPFDCIGEGVHSKKKDETGDSMTEADRMDIDTPAEPEPFAYVPDDD